MLRKNQEILTHLGDKNTTFPEIKVIISLSFVERRHFKAEERKPETLQMYLFSLLFCTKDISPPLHFANHPSHLWAQASPLLPTKGSTHASFVSIFLSVHLFLCSKWLRWGEEQSWETDASREMLRDSVICCIWCHLFSLLQTPLHLFPLPCVVSIKAGAFLRCFQNGLFNLLKYKQLKLFVSFAGPQTRLLLVPGSLFPRGLALHAARLPGRQLRPLLGGSVM